MPSASDQIAAASAKHAQLLNDLSKTDPAPASLASQLSYISDLKKQIATCSSELEKARAVAQKELKDHEKYRDSHFRRFAHKASGKKEKFAERADKEECEYFDAIQAQKQAEDRLAHLNDLHKDAEAARSELEPQVKRNGELQKELDALYNSIFAGKTPEFPQEDEKESACKAAETHYGQVQAALKSEQQAMKTLSDALRVMGAIFNDLDRAIGASRMDMFGGGMMSGIMKRNALEDAESGVEKVKMLVAQAQRLSPAVRDAGPINIARLNIWGDVVFDNIFSDMEMHQRIKDSEAQLQVAGRKIQQQIQEGKQRIQTIESDAAEARNALDRSRQELQKIREETFQTVEHGGAPPMYGDAPPAYS